MGEVVHEALEGILRNLITNIEVVDYNWLESYDSKSKEKLGGQTYGPFLLLDPTIAPSSYQEVTRWRVST